MHPFDRHQRGVLQFSGGKDSLACLHLLRPYWDRVLVMWVNTGAAFPETIAQMKAIRALVPFFYEVRSNQPKQVAEHGHPGDVLDVWETPDGRFIASSNNPAVVQSPIACCASNIWIPMHKATLDFGATLVIRGQRDEEHRKSPVRSGHVEQGIEYWFPIEKWSQLDVHAFLEKQNVELPAHYAYVDSSLDCWSCTAYLNENVGKFRYMKEKHPEKHAHVTGVVRKIVDQAERGLSFYREVIGEI